MGYREKVVLPFGNQRIIGWRRTEPVIMPSELDQTRRADGFRRRNRGKTYTWYEFLGIPFSTSIALDGWWTDPEALTALPHDAFDATGPKRVAMMTTDGAGNATNFNWRDNDGEGIGAYELEEQHVREDPDCALLDLYIGQPIEGAKEPLEAFVHGGGNTENHRLPGRWRGDGIVPWHNYANIEWPLSMQGFFTSPWATSSEINHAHRVVLAALEWVQINGWKLGIDPDTVGIEGTSAGAHLVTSLIPQGGTLFHRVISHSGGGTGKHATRELAESVGRDFWNNLSKGKPAHFDPTRTIQEVADQDGIDRALRLGPSPAQMLSRMNNRLTFRRGAGGALVRGSAPAINIWPAEDGDLIQARTLVGEVERWPLSVAFMGTWSFNEASLVDDAAESDGLAYLRRVGITGEPEISEAIAAFESLYRGRWPRPAYGHCIFGYAVERMARDFAARGGAAYRVFHDDDSPGNGRRKMGHANQVAWWHGKAQWQMAQGLRRESLRFYERDWRLQYHLCRSASAFIRHGDPNADLPPGVGLDLYDDPKGALADFEDWQAADAESNATNVITDIGDPQRPAMQVTRDFDKAIWDVFDANFVP